MLTDNGYSIIFLSNVGLHSTCRLHRTRLDESTWPREMGMYTRCAKYTDARRTTLGVELCLIWCTLIAGCVLDTLWIYLSVLSGSTRISRGMHSSMTYVLQLEG